MSNDDKNDWDFKVEELKDESGEKKNSFSDRLKKRSHEHLNFDLESTKKPTREERPSANLKNRRVYSSSDDSSYAIPFDRYKPASMRKRALASTIDGLIVISLTYLVIFCLYAFLPKEAVSLLKSIPFFSSVIGFIFTYIFIIGPLQAKSTTIGKRVFHLEVVSEDGPYLSMMPALMRETIGKSVSITLFPISIGLILLQKERRTLHDYIAGTMVIDTE